MTAIKVNSKKWISEESTEEEEAFSHGREMQAICYAVTKVILDLDNKWKGSQGKSTSHSLSNRSYILELVNIQVNPLIFACVRISIPHPDLRPIFT